MNSGDRQQIYTYVASARRDVPIEDGTEVLTLRELAAQVLQTDKRLNDLYDVRPDRLMTNYWQRLESVLTEEDPIKINGVDVPVYSRNKNLWIGLEKRVQEKRFGLYIEQSPDLLKQRIQQDFDRRHIQN